MLCNSDVAYNQKRVNVYNLYFEGSRNYLSTVFKGPINIRSTKRENAPSDKNFTCRKTALIRKRNVFKLWQFLFDWIIEL